MPIRLFNKKGGINELKHHEKYWYAAAVHLADLDGLGGFHSSGWQPGCDLVITGNRGRSVHHHWKVNHQSPSPQFSREGDLINKGVKNDDLDNSCNISGFVAVGGIWFKLHPEHSQGRQPGSHPSGYRGGSDYLKPSWDSLV